MFRECVESSDECLDWLALFLPSAVELRAFEYDIASSDEVVVELALYDRVGFPIVRECKRSENIVRLVSHGVDEHVD